MDPNPKSLQGKAFHILDYVIRPDLNRIERGSESVQVEPRVMDVLVYLAEHAGQVISRDTLLDDVWGDTVVVEHVLTRAISELRRILKDDSEQPRFIETIRKRGYRLVSPVIVPSAGIAEPAEHGDIVLGERTVSDAPGAGTKAARPGFEVSATARAAVGRRRSFLLWLAPIAAIALVAMALSGRFLREQPGTRSPVVLEAIPFTSYVGNETKAAFSPDGTRVAFVWTGADDTNADIYVKQRDTDTPLRLTQDPSFDSHPAWSPDGATIAFVRVGQTEAAIHTVPSIGGVERKLYTATSRLRGLDWAPDGGRLVFSEREHADAPYRLRSLSLSTLDIDDLTTPPATTSDISPAISPDGRTVAFIRESLAGNQSIHVVPLAGGEARRVSQPLILAEGLVWRQGGEEVVFTSAPAGPASLWSLHVSSGNVTPLIVRDEWVGDPTCPRTGPGLVYETWRCQSNVWEVDLLAEGSPREAASPVIQSTRWDGNACVSPDGERIVFASARSGNAELWACRRDGSQTVRLTSLGGLAVTAPCWSPQGDRVAFSISPDGFMAVHVINVAGGPPRRLTFGEHNDNVCDWSPDGSRIYFASDRSGEWEIWSLAPGDGEAVQLTRRGGIEAFVSSDGAYLHYIKARGNGVWRMPAGGGTEELVYDGLNRGQRTNWTIHDTRIYSFARDREGQYIACHDYERSETRTILRVQGIGGPGITVTRDGRALLYARTDDAATDLKLVEAFR